jgi:hypothetical protein
MSGAAAIARARDAESFASSSASSVRITLATSVRGACLAAPAASTRARATLPSRSAPETDH